MKAAIIQLAVKEGQIAENEKKALALLEEAAKQGSELLVLPELWNSGYDLEHLSLFAAPLGENTGIQKLQKLAAAFGVYIVAGSVATRKNGNYYNTSVTIDKQGNIIGEYDKIHLFPLGLQEDKYFTAGDHFCLVDTPWGKLGVILCYDVRFPALCRNLVLRGATILVVPAEFAQARITHWQILNRARAIENQCFVLAANVTGEIGSPYSGSSMIISPWGEIIAQGDEKEQIVYGELDFTQIEKVRRVIPVFQQRQDILDEIDHKSC